MPLPTHVDHSPVEIVQARCPEDMSPGVTRELVNCWMTVANNGGAVGFPFPPVGMEDVKAVADRLIADLDPEYSQLLLAQVDGILAGWLSLSRYRNPVVPHWGMVKRVQTHPDFRGRGIGSALMQRVRDVSRDELGLEQLRLEARGYSCPAGPRIAECSPRTLAGPAIHPRRGTASSMMGVWKGPSPAK